MVWLLCGVSRILLSVPAPVLRQVSSEEAGLLVFRHEGRRPAPSDHRARPLRTGRPPLVRTALSALPGPRWRTVFLSWLRSGKDGRAYHGFW
jgi:hypothetical protein